MPLLDNPRHERFAQFVANGRTATEAYELAGYRPNRQNAQRLTTNDDVRARIAELQQQAAEKHEITRDTITKMLLEDRAGALEAGQFGAARAASESLGKLHGLYVERKESTVTHKRNATDYTDAELIAIIEADEKLGGERVATAQAGEEEPDSVH